ncbi:PQQ-binding-like beta-propeller repeat protein [Streptomyces sp. NPDC047072]|uniref:serine/threonine-protein kinase n=1 Tax=Streptomyces sp. NPDC047072 TaxID=3154809 RepID=UPI003409B75D
MTLTDEDPRVVGDYVLTSRLGSGGMGVVYEARSASGRRVALKVVHQQFAADHEFRVRFRREVEAARRVSGVFTAAVVDADPEAPRPWMATAFVAGDTLSERVRRQGPLRGAELRQLAVGLCEALRDIHRAGVVHRDLKPSNIVLSDDGPRVIDFGISRDSDDQALTTTGRVMGTPPFMSPEQFSAPRDVGPASDIFSLASVLVFAATGGEPFTRDTPFMTAFQVVHEPPDLTDVPDALRRTLAPCLEKDPEARPRAEVLLKTLWTLPDDDGTPVARAAGGAPEPVTRGPGGRADTPTSASSSRSGRRRTTTRIALGTALALLVGGGTWAALDDGVEAAGSGKSPVAATPARVSGALPAGWKGPWKAGVVPAEWNQTGGPPTCRLSGASLFCESDGSVARIGVADGSVAWFHGDAQQSKTYNLVGVGGGTVVEQREDVANHPGDGHVTGVSPATGKVLWTVKGYAGQSAVTDDLLVTDFQQARGLHALDIRTGEERWTFHTGYQDDGGDCTAVASGGRLFAECGSGTQEPAFYALSASGATQWTYKSGPRTFVDPVGVSGSAVVVRQTSDSVENRANHIFALDGSGKRLKGFALNEPDTSKVAVADGTAFTVRDNGEASAYRISDGRRLWTTQLQQDGLSMPVLTGRVVLYATSSGRVLAVDRNTGKVLWTTARMAAENSGDEWDVVDRVRVAGRAVLVASAGPLVTAIDGAKPGKLPPSSPTVRGTRAPQG